MYRIKLPTGDETTYPTLEAFTAGVRSGVVTPDSEIHHARADRWIPVSMHPHYKLALDAAGEGSSRKTSGPAAAGAPAAPARPSTGPVPAVQVPAQKTPTTGPMRAIQAAAPQTPTTGQTRAIRLATPMAGDANGTTELPRLSLTKPNAAPSSPRVVPPSKNLRQVDVEEVDRLLDLLDTKNGAPVALQTEQPAPRLAKPEPPAPKVSLPGAVPPSAGLPAETDLELLGSEPLTGPRVVRPSTAVEAIRSPEPVKAVKPEPPATPPRPSQPKTVIGIVREPSPEPVQSQNMTSVPMKLVDPLKPAAGLPLILPEEPAAPAASLKPAAPVAEVRATSAPAPAAPLSQPRLEKIEPVAAKATPAKPTPAQAAPAQEHFHRAEELEIPSPVMLTPVEVASTGSASLPVQHSGQARSGPTAREGQRRSMGLIAAGIAATLVIGVGLVAWRPWASRSPRPATAGTEPAPTIAQVSSPAQPLPAPQSAAALAGRTPASPAHKDSASRVGATGASPASPATDVVAPPPEILPAAPKLDLKGAVGDVKVSQDIPKFDAGGNGPAAVSPAVLVSHYTAAYAAAGADLDEALNASSLSGLFVKNRISSPDGIDKGRQSIETAMSAIRQWRTRTGNIERAYQDTLLQIQRNRKTSAEELRAWAGRPTQQEGKETAELVDLMLGQAENVLDLLSAQEGKFSISGDAIKFNDGDASHRYGTLRVWLAQKSDAWAQTPESAIPVTLRRVLKAVGKPALPPEK